MTFVEKDTIQPHLVIKTFASENVVIKQNE